MFNHQPVTLLLDSEEAGYLLNALTEHLGGVLLTKDAPLGRIRSALQEAGVKEVHADPHHLHEGYPSLYGAPGSVWDWENTMS